MEPLPVEISAAVFLSFLQCPRRAWYDYHGYAEESSRSEFSPAAVRRAGWEGVFQNAVETILPPVWADLRGLPREERVRRCREILEKTDSAPTGSLLGCSIAADSLIAEPDVLIFREDGLFDTLELKTSVGPKGKYIDELAWNVEVLSRRALRPGRVLLAHLNGTYTAGEDGNGPDLFTVRDVTNKVLARGSAIAGFIRELRPILSSSVPPAPRTPCFGHDDCPFAGHCAPPTAKHHISTLHQGRRIAEELYSKGFEGIADVPPETRLSRKQRIQIDAVVSGQPFTNLPALDIFLRSLEFPLSFLDFETFSSPLPLFAGASPWEHLPFQFSLHILESWDAPPSHRSFLADERQDPRPAFVKALRAELPDKGSVVVYNRRFEAGILAALGGRYPDYGTWAERTAGRMADLLVPFADFHYYHPEQAGRLSMKKVLPALTGRSYEGFVVGNGETANAVFAGMVLRGRRGLPAGDERGRLRAALEEYCGLDTEGMVLIIRKLRGIVTK